MINEICGKNADLMKIHKEGYASLAVVFAVGLALSGLSYWMIPSLFGVAIIVSILLFIIVLQFFRHPERSICEADKCCVYAPADGRIVVVEETEEPEYFKDRRLMISVFMSPVNVHVNRSPIPGQVRYSQYHPGKYLVAWHPKSSTENERHTSVIGNEHGDILLRQIAGALARRICNYLTPGQTIEQGAEMGFIKFGSRVDILLPLNTEIKVKIGDVVRANRSVIAQMPGR